MDAISEEARAALEHYATLHGTPRKRFRQKGRYHRAVAELEGRINDDK
jgi:hypothetical protein